MFKVVGKGIFPKEVLIMKLKEWGVYNPDVAIQHAEKKGKVVCGNDIRILLVGGSI